MSEIRNALVLDTNAKAQLPAEYFDVQTNVPLIHQVVNAQLAAARQGTHSTKTRGEVSGGGAKPWRQKGTGRARQGSRRAPQWTGGGIVHGPQPRSYAQRTPKKMIAKALLGALSDRAREDHIHVIKTLVEGEKPSTKKALEALSNLSSSRVLVVLHRFEDVAWLSLRNVPNIAAIAVDQLNAYDVLIADDVVFTTDALAEFIGSEVVEIATEPQKPTKKTAAKKAKKAEPEATTAEPEAAEPETEVVESKAEAVEPEVTAEEAEEAAEPAESPAKKPAAKKPAAKKTKKAEVAESETAETEAIDEKETEK